MTSSSNPTAEGKQASWSGRFSIPAVLLLEKLNKLPLRVFGLFFLAKKGSIGESAGALRQGRPLRPGKGEDGSCCDDNNDIGRVVLAGSI